MNVAWAQQTSTAAPSGTTETADVNKVPIEEYVPKVIIEGKWGTGPGEFGTWGQFVNSEEESYQPSSIAIDNQGNIYILDLVNERIQKFDSNGKYLKSLLVESFSGKRHEAETTVMVDRDNPDNNVHPDHPRRIDVKRGFLDVEPDFKTRGINIVIDSKDALYYYLKRTINGKETGEVWEFKKDKLVKKTTVPMTTMLSYGVGLDIDRDDDSLWIGEVDKNQRGKHYQYRTGQILNTAEVRKQKEVFLATKEGKQASLRPKPKHYLDIDVSNVGIKVVKKLN